MTGSRVEGINTTLGVTRKLLLSSSQNTRKSGETNKGDSAEVGVMIGSNGVWKTLYGEPVYPDYKRYLEKQQQAFERIVSDRIELYKRTGK